MATKRKPRKKAGKGTSTVSAAPSPPAVRRVRTRKPPPPLPPPTTTLQQELRSMAQSGARSLRTLLVVVFVLAGITGIGVVLWSLRPTPSYSSEAVEEGSPFDVTFRVENRNRWFPLADLGINCVLAHVRASGAPPTMIAATDMRFPTAGTRRLEPGEAATFTCPFRTLTNHPIYEDASVAQRAEIYFSSRYDLPFLGFRITDNSPNFFLNTRLLPPRWTARPPT